MHNFLPQYIIPNSNRTTRYLIIISGPSKVKFALFLYCTDVHVYSRQILNLNNFYTA